MATNESKLFQRIKKRISTERHDRVDRIENGMGAGMPDVNYCLNGAEGWIELKCPKIPKRSSTALFGAGNHPVGIDQSNWFLSQNNAGGLAFLLIGPVETTDLILVSAELASNCELVNSMTLDELAENSIWKFWSDSPFEGGWHRLRSILRGEGRIEND